MGFIDKAWRGQEKLWVVFWIYNVLAWFLLKMGFTAILSVHLPFSAPFIYIALWCVYSIWAYVALWRCAFNTRMEIFGYLARIWIALGVLGFIFFLITIIGTGALLVKQLAPNMQVERSADGKTVSYHSTGGGVETTFGTNPNTAAAPATPPASIRPAPAPLSTPESQCRTQMENYARAHQVDPVQYIQSNAAYLQQCTAYISGKSTSLGK